MGHRSRPTAAQQFAPADLLRGILVVSSFGFWAVMLGLMPVLLFRVWLVGLRGPARMVKRRSQMRSKCERRCKPEY